MADSSEDKQGNQEQIAEILTKPRMLDHKNPAYVATYNVRTIRLRITSRWNWLKYLEIQTLWYSV